MENTWGGSMLPGVKGEAPSAGGDYAAEGSADADGGADPNYMYSSHAAHNSAGDAEGY